MGTEFLLAMNGLVALLTGALAVWILYLNPVGRVNRALALMLGLQSLLSAVLLLRRVADSPDYFEAVAGYLLLAQVPALVNFFIAYNWRASAGSRLARLALLTITILLELSYAWNHLLLTDFTSDGANRAPLSILENALPLLWAATALWFMALARKASSPPQARFHRLLGLAFLSACLLRGALTWSVVAQKGMHFLFHPDLSTAAALGQVLQLASFPLGVLAAIILVREWSEAEPRRAGTLWFTLILAGTAFIGFLAGYVTPMIGASGVATDLFYLALAIARLPFPLLLAYAVARRSIERVDPFEIDARAALVLNRGTMGAILLAVFVVLSEAAQMFFQNLASREGTAWANALAIIGASGLVFLLYPIRQFGERISRSALPSVKPIEHLDAQERARLYEEQAQIAWADGTMTRKERLLLDRLRDRLGVSHEQAHEIENRAAGIARSTT